MRLPCGIASGMVSQAPSGAASPEDGAPAGREFKIFRRWLKLGRAGDVGASSRRRLRNGVGKRLESRHLDSYKMGLAGTVQ